MLKPLEVGCKKCGTVVHVEIRLGSDHIDIKLKEARPHDKFGREVEILCKKCGKPVLKFGLDPA